MRTTGGCRDNRACFCVKGGQLSLCQRGGGEMEEKERWKDAEKRAKEGERQRERVG